MRGGGGGLGGGRGLKLLQQLQQVVVDLPVEIGQAVLQDSFHLQTLGIHARQDVQLVLFQHVGVAVHLSTTGQVVSIGLVG